MPEVVVGVLLVAGCALASIVWQREASATTTIVVAARAVPRGTMIGPADLRGAEVGGETAGLISGADAAALLGEVALVAIPAGSPLVASMLGSEPALTDGESLTPLALRDGDLPPDLATHDRVRVLVTGRADATGAAVTTLLDEPAVVWAVGASSDGVSTIVTIRGSLDLAVAVAAAAQVRLVRVEG